MSSPSSKREPIVGYAKNQKATAYGTMSFAKWNELLQKSNKIESPKKSVRDS